MVNSCMYITSSSPLTTQKSSGTLLKQDRLLLLLVIKDTLDFLWKKYKASVKSPSLNFIQVQQCPTVTSLFTEMTTPLSSAQPNDRSTVSQKWHLRDKALSISVIEWEKCTLASKKLQMKDRCQPSRDCLALNQKSEARKLAFVMHSNLSSDDPGWKTWRRTNKI